MAAPLRHVSVPIAAIALMCCGSAISQNAGTLTDKSDQRASVALKPFEIVPTVELTSSSVKKAKSELRITEVGIASERKQSELAESAANLGKPASTDFDDTVALQSRALTRWDDTIVTTKAAKWIDRRMDAYKSLLGSNDEGKSDENCEGILRANKKAQDQIIKGLKPLIRGGTFYSEQAEHLAHVYVALKEDEESIRNLGCRVSGGREALNTRLAEDFPAENTQTLIDFQKVKVVVVPESLSKPAQALITEASLTATLPAPSIDLNYGNESGRRTTAENEEAMKSEEAAVAIRTIADQQVVGNGVLIGRNLILTCAHVAEEAKADVEPTNVEFVATGRDKIQHRYSLGQRVGPGGVWGVTKNSLDYALFEVGLDRDDGSEISALISPWRISRHRLIRENAVYGSGYERASRTRGNFIGKILYPFQLKDVDEILAYFVIEQRDEGVQASNMYPRVQMLKKAYRSDKGFFWLVRTVHQPRGEQPIHGIQCNTFEGDSGSPVFSYQQRDLIGVLMGGKPRGQPQDKATWTDMEYVLPLGPVIDQLDNTPQLADWRKRYAVDVVDDNNKLEAANR